MLILYSTLACHLCEQAKQVLAHSSLAADALKEVDIADDDDLIERYGVRIPVLRDEASASELGWPFNVADVEQWLRGIRAIAD